MTVYVSAVLYDAEAKLYRRLVSGPGGRCMACGEYEPCLVDWASVGSWFSRAAAVVAGEELTRMGFKTPRPVVFRRQDRREENFLVVMHYLAMTLWDVGSGVEAVNALQALLPAVSDGPTAALANATDVTEQ
jgi:hypothetical protein